MKRVALIAVVLAGGCEKTDTLYCQMHPQDHANCGGTTDAHGIDTLVYMDAPAAPVCVGAAGTYQVCVPMPGSPKTLTTGTVIDTTPGVQGSPCLPTQPDGWINAGQPASCFIVGTDVTIQDITVTGPRPLVVVATGTINVTGTIEAASHATVTGPGSPFSGCVAGTTPGSNSQGGGGGEGASFTSKGGDGGDGDNGNGAKGTASAAQTATKLRAGCPGMTGGDGGAATTGGKGGAGGGAIALLAMTSISLSSTSIINVSGAGAAASAAPRGGGGGGGSGGMILLRAGSITGTGAKLVANGGGGSSGTNNNAAGMPGNDPIASTPGVSALPVTGPGGAGTGNSGFSTAGLALAGGPGNSGLGGGGGGGGGGYIEASVAIGGAITSPPVTVVP